MGCASSSLSDAVASRAEVAEPPKRANRSGFNKSTSQAGDLAVHVTNPKQSDSHFAAGQTSSSAEEVPAKAVNPGFYGLLSTGDFSPSVAQVPFRTELLRK